MSSLYNSVIHKWLQQFKVEKGCEYTHTSIGKPAGSYNIPLEKKSELIDLLHQHIFVNNQPCHLTEAQPKNKFSNIKIDIDLKFPLDVNERRYTNETISQLVNLYNSTIKECLQIEDYHLQAFVFERDRPRVDRGVTKDGIHIIYPYIICNVDIQHIIREKVLEKANPIFEPIKSINKIDDIIDKSVVSSNNWFMYGCSKLTAKPYKITHVFNSQGEEVDDFDMSDKDLIELLSMRDHHEHSYVKEIEGIQSTVQPIVQPTVQPIKKKITMKAKRNIPDLEEIVNLVHILSLERADNENLWYNVGVCLHSIDDVLLDTWIDFSKQSSKYTEGECADLWKKMSFKEDGLTIKSLYYWARGDNHSEYEKIVVTPTILNALSQTTTDIAYVFYKMFPDTFVYVSKKAWYSFNDTRWILSLEDTEIMRVINTHLVPKFIKMSHIFEESASLLKDDDPKKTTLLNKAKNMFDISHRLRDISFKKKIVDELKILYANSQFVELLDKNTDLIGFENGVFDLSILEFRNGKPDDYLTMSTGYNYQTYKEDDPIIVDIYTYLKRTFPLPKHEKDSMDLLDAVLIIYSSFLHGGNKEQHFYIQSNGGSNGKSQFVLLLDAAFGQYSRTVDSDFFLEQKKSFSGQASPELACLKGIKLIHSEEPNEGKSYDISRIKEQTGKSKISCRPLYGNQFEFIPQFHILFSCNKRPKLPNTTKEHVAVWRRIRNIPFVATFVDTNQPIDNDKYIYHKDPNIDDNFEIWKSGMMFILIETYKTYLKTGIIQTQQMLAEDNKYQEDTEPFSNYFNDFLEITTNSLNDGLTLSQIWNSYKKDKIYYEANVKLKDVKNYLINSKKLNCITHTKRGKEQVNSLFRDLKWINEKPKEEKIEIEGCMC
jgi:P4 family phage/plasmid primase-like protien